MIIILLGSFWVNQRFSLAIKKPIHVKLRYSGFKLVNKPYTHGVRFKCIVERFVIYFVFQTKASNRQRSASFKSKDLY
ncbi:hypothetical protein GGE08_001597 [Muricauda sp. ARW1Y1]|nr:hypothetical protein [Muricauda sp. ARW1Y1]